MEKDYTAIFPLQILGNEKILSFVKMQKNLLRNFFFSIFFCFSFLSQTQNENTGSLSTNDSHFVDNISAYLSMHVSLQPRSELVTKFKCCSYSLWWLLFVHRILYMRDKDNILPPKSFMCMFYKKFCNAFLNECRNDYKNRYTLLFTLYTIVQKYL